MTSGQGNDRENTRTPSGESLEELEERTAEVMADARKKVDRARATLHDQVLSEARGSEAADEERPEPDSDRGDADRAE